MYVHRQKISYCFQHHGNKRTCIARQLKKVTGSNLSSAEPCDWFADSKWRRNPLHACPCDVAAFIHTQLYQHFPPNVERSWGRKAAVQISLSHMTPCRKSSWTVQGWAACVKEAKEEERHIPGSRIYLPRSALIPGFGSFITSPAGLLAVEKHLRF